MAIQIVIAQIFWLSLIGTAIHLRLLNYNYRSLSLFLTFSVLLIAQLTCLLVYTILIYPHVSPLRHLPKAPQPPISKRLLKEPNAFHFERWINQVHAPDGMIRYFGFLNSERILLTTPKPIQQVLQTQAYNFDKPYAQKTHLKRVADNGLVVAEGDVHKLHRRIMSPAFRLGNVKELFYPLFWKKALEMVRIVESALAVSNKLENINQESSTEGGVLEMDEFVSRVIFDIIGIASFSFDWKSLSNPDLYFRPLRYYRSIFEPSLANKVRLLLAFVLSTSVLNILPMKFNRLTEAALTQVRTIGREVISTKHARRRQADLEKHPYKTSDVMDVIMSANKMNDRELLDQFMVLQGGGLHTSAAAVMSAIWFLAQPQNHHIQDKLREEIRSIIPVQAEISEVDPSWFDNMPYLDAVQKEVLRLHSAFSWTGRQTVIGTTINGISIRRGTIISISPWALHRSTSLWGPDAAEFKPERWLHQDGQVPSRPDPREGCSFIAFGFGPRVCVAEKFAKAELNCVLSGLFGRFRLTFEEGMRLPSVTQRVTVAFREPLRVKVELVAK